LEININKHQPIRGSNCIPLPNHLENTKACTIEENNPEISITVLGLDIDGSTIIGPYYFTNNKTDKVLHSIYISTASREG